MSVAVPALRDGPAERAPARRRRKGIRRRRAGALLVLGAIGVVLLQLTLSTPPAALHRHAPRPQVPRATGTRSNRPSPGALPQTAVVPSANTRQFAKLMSDLWRGVVEDRLHPALPAFFPEGAYAQLKAISDARADWSGRLVHDYRLDIATAHALLGSGAASAELIGVRVVAKYAHWIEPGVCDNSIGYYEMPNARVVYREHGRVRSFGIASMISWRGVWYVVHFGAILRAADVGQVDAPASGPGVSLYSATC